MSGGTGNRPVGEGSRGGSGPGGLSELRETPVTYGLLAAFLVVFVATQVAEARFDTDLYRRWAVEFAHLGDAPTWVTATFLHYNPVHLLVNSVFLSLFGRGVEREFGSRVLLTVFLVTGVATAVLGTVLAGLNSCGVGALATASDCGVLAGGSSMALAGLLGFVARRRPHVPMTVVPSFRVVLWRVAGVLLVVSLFGMYTPVDPLRTILGFPPGHAYHFVGVLFGLALGSVWRPDE